ncbi:uncharacterized protein LOC125179525 [Hyalella azteca]|uniref:Uncharacterized protein LOC125179525 n=1 Tax=Hyalella azteca TaxID=294128 RepID=A0A979FYE4_HYAAZ|nr:uncharacterized protein LOC125179525 [Hyalella azteca]
MPPLNLLGDRVRLVRFRGCVGTSDGAAALASVARDADLHIRMAAPVELSALGRTVWRLEVYTRPFPPPGPSSPTWPLPSSSLPPYLYVEGADEGCWRAVAHTITSLAPPCKTFVRLLLPDCRLRGAELPPLLQKLRDEGIRTDGWGDTRAEVDEKEGGVVLFITDSVPQGGPAVPSDCALESLKRHQRLQRLPLLTRLLGFYGVSSRFEVRSSDEEHSDEEHSGEEHSDEEHSDE